MKLNCIFRIIFLLSMWFCPVSAGNIFKIASGTVINRQISSPSTAYIYHRIDNKRVSCTGSLLTRSIVLTAAHCVPKTSYTTLHIDFHHATPYGDVRKLAERYAKRWVEIFDPQDEQDIALIELDSPVSTTCAGYSYGVVHLPIANPGDDKWKSSWQDLDIELAKCEALGYGLNEKSSLDYQLRKTDLSVTADHKLLSADLPHAKLCPGDSGGPIICYHDNGDGVLMGISTTSAGMELSPIPQPCNLKDEETGQYLIITKLLIHDIRRSLDFIRSILVKWRKLDEFRRDNLSCGHPEVAQFFKEEDMKKLLAELRETFRAA